LDKKGTAMKPAEREAMRQQACDMRAWARRLAAETLVFRADVEVHRVHPDVANAASKELLSQLQRAVSKHAVMLRRLDEPFEHVIADATRLATEAAIEARIRYDRPEFVLAANVQPDLARWSTEGYLGAVGSLTVLER